MRHYYLLALSLLLSSCSSEYAPSEAMLRYKSEMNLVQALEVLQQRIWSEKGAEGICGSRGFWYDEKSDFKFTQGGIDLFAYKRGKVTKKIRQKLGDIIVFERDYYKYHFDFSKVRAIHIYDDPLLLPAFVQCNTKEAIEKYYIIDIYQTDSVNIKFIVYEQNLDKALAALSIVFPDIVIMNR